MLQDSRAANGGHAEPFVGGVMIVRVFICSPPPHIAVHGPSTHSETSQS